MQLSTQGQWLAQISKGAGHNLKAKVLLVLFGNAALAALAVFAAQGTADHAHSTEVGVVKPAFLQQLIDDRFLFVAATCFDNIPRVFNHGLEEEVGT